MKMFELHGKKAVVTGGSRGIGKAIAEGLGEAGAEVCIIGRKINVVDIAKEIGPNFHGVIGNLGKRNSIRKAFAEAVKKLKGKLNILVNAAGIQRRNKCEEFTEADWDEVLELNLTAVFLLCKLAGNIMLKQGGGKIINIASVMSFLGGWTIPAYAVSKGGIAQITKSFSNEWASRGVNVNAIAPGYIDTNMNKSLINDKIRNEQILARIPAGRWGKPEDIKGIAVFLASEASDYVNGAIIPVDGGYLGK